MPLQPFADHLFTTTAWPLETWDDLAAAMKVPAAGLVRVNQVHGREVLVHRVGRQAPPGLPDADIILSDDPSVALAVQTADCVPLLIADRRTGAVAAAHAGWRGLAAGVPAVTIDALARELGSRPVDLVAAVGPAIGSCCYEVGAEVRHRFEAGGFSGADLARWFFERPQSTMGNPSMRGVSAAGRAGHWFFDGWCSTRNQLESAGVPPAQIHVAELCTASHPGLFCSYRRDGNAAGRIAGAIRRLPRRP